MSIDIYLAYVTACILLALVPGPSVTLVVATGLRHGVVAAMLSILGTQIGLAIVVGVLALGLAAVMATVGVLFDWIRFLGAAYLIWLGIRLIREPGAIGAGAPPRRPKGGFVWQGLVVLLSNPKVLMFYGAFIPQFVGAEAGQGGQIGTILLLGFTFNIVAGVTDIAYALMSGRARTWMSAPRARLLSWVSGAVMIGGGIWLALSRAR